MNSFNNIFKVKYTRNQQEVVALKEYIIFDDETAKEKYVILKMANNLKSLNMLQFKQIKSIQRKLKRK